MKVLYQWAQRNPTDWIEIDSGLFGSLPTRALPQSGQIGGQNNLLGWVNDLCIQGVHFNGSDHVAVEDVVIGAEVGVKVTAWWDDPIDYPPGERRARVWTFLPLAPDRSFGSGLSTVALENMIIADTVDRPSKQVELLTWVADPAHWPINTRQSQVIYAEGQRFLDLIANPPQNTTVLPWAAFVPPPTAITRHQVWLTDAKYAEHTVASHSFRDNDPLAWGWRHWAEHLVGDETILLPDGRLQLKDQRLLGRYLPNSRTLTWYQRDTNLAQGWLAATHEDSLLGTAGAGETESGTTNADLVLVWGFATPSGEPNSTDWPNGNYRCQLDCTAASTGLVYQVRGDNTTTVTDRFYRLDSSVATIVEELGGSSTAFSGTGLKLRTRTVNFAAGAASERFGFGVNADGDSHGDAITLRFSADAWTDGPWPSPGGDGTDFPWGVFHAQPVQTQVAVIAY